MMKINYLRFGTAGIPWSAENKTTEGGILEIRRLGLDAMEIEFVRGVRMSISKAKEIKRVAENAGVCLTSHAPYYINLLSEDRKKVDASIQRILETAKVTYAAGGYSIVFHAAYYGKIIKEEAYRGVRERVKLIVDKLMEEGIEIWVRPETTGKISQFGTLEEVIRLSEEIENVMPCIDFAHIHARSNGRFNSYEEFSAIINEVERRLGREALDNMHIHFSGIEYNEKGEVRHLDLEKSDIDFRALTKCWKDFNLKGVAISESPNLEKDAILMKKIFESISV